MHISKLSVQLVTWNGAIYIPYLFDSLRKQTSTDWELHIFDNNSTDNTRDLLQTELEKGFPVPYTYTESPQNIGFAGGHNELYRTHGSDESSYVLLLNQDMYLTADCIKTVVSYLDTHTTVAAVTPRLMRWDIAALAQPQSSISDSFTDTIDSLGLKAYRSRQVTELHAGEQWSQLKKNIGSAELPVFGVSGALPCYRKNALAAVVFEDGGIFDVSYQSYKEDVDLAFRLQSAGFASTVVFDAVAYHDRSAPSQTGRSDVVAAKNKHTQSEWIRYHSYKNHIVTLIKNEYIGNALRDCVPILWYEAKKFVWYLLFDRSVLFGLRTVSWYDVWIKRKFITARKTVSARTIRIWWT
jgi:GT2 family glycosyltransferase